MTKNISKKITLDELIDMSPAQVKEVFNNGHPIPPGALDNKQYRGVDLSLPDFMHKLLWLEFRKTFYRDPDTGVLRGWNVKMEQVGWKNPGVPKRKKNGTVQSFGHYQLLPAKGLKFPGGWQGADYLNYKVPGNSAFDVYHFGYCPLVAVNEGDANLLLGWEVFKLGNIFLPLPDYWALQCEGPIDEIVPVS
jgi:hypothetical protein